VSKTSPVISGVKDTRPPVLFGAPQPANAILGIGDDLMLRFSEPIAGNYLDEDNNFQLKGVTNETGITAGTTIHFDGSVNSYAKTQITRSLTGKSFSLDMLVRPTNPNEEEQFFSYEVVPGIDFLFGKTADNRLYAQVGQERVTSKQLESPMLAFTRVIMAFDHEKKTVRFFTGTSEVTDPATGALPDETVFNVSSPLVFGQGFTGDMLEARLWSKALTLDDEIAATNGHYLTGYERELLAYYRMNEGKGEVITDRANGANLYLSGTTWVLQKGISLKLNNEAVQLAGDLLARSENYDETLMFWFKTNSADAPVFRAGWIHNDSVSKGTLLALEGGSLVLHSDGNRWTAGSYADGEWHHFALTLSRSFNTAAVFVDGKMTNSASATKFRAVSGAMYLGGEGFKGNIDELAVFEQALPAQMVQEYYNASPVGDEMGLMAYLPFEQQKLNPNGVLEQVFSINDQRQFRDANGNVVDKVVPLVLNQQSVISMADKSNFAPTSDKGLMSKLNFGWTFDQQDLLINLKMQDYEINKQSVYVTVRDVEDLHGNPMPSPVSWVAFVDRCPLRWDLNTQNYFVYYGELSNEPGTGNCYQDIIINTTGKRHQFKIESLPDWLRAEPSYGSIDPLETKPIAFCPDYEMPAGIYTDIVYLTDENGLSEPLYITYEVKAVCPYQEPNSTKYPMKMSVCGQVKIDGKYDADSNDKVIALFRNECVGMANVSFSQRNNTSDVYLTIYGDAKLNKKELSFLLWQASTGKVLNLATDRPIKFAHGNVEGCGSNSPVIFTTSGTETQNISIKPGWNWVSSNLQITGEGLPVTGQQKWHEGDIIKTPDKRLFSVYNDTANAFRGTLTHWDYRQMYMVFSINGNIMRLCGDKLKDDNRHVTIKGDGQWSSLPCLLSEATPITEAMADYYDHAAPGDLVKSHDRFAVFSQDKHWVGDLTTLRPGEGYMMRRMETGDVTMSFFEKKSNSPSRMNAAPKAADKFSNPQASGNMTMIAAIEGLTTDGQRLLAYVGDELVGIAEPVTYTSSEKETGDVYFLTIQNDLSGELRFTTESGTPLYAQPLPSEKKAGEVSRAGGVSYQVNAHYGSPESPVILTPAGKDTEDVYKIIEDDHVIIIRGGERYDVTGVKLQ